MMIPMVAVLVLAVHLWSVEAQVAGCPAEDRCGGVEVPYPFAIRAGCSLPGFGLTCDTTRKQPRLMLGNNSTLEVREISVANSTVRAIDTAGAVNLTTGNGTWAAGGGGPYVVSEKFNQLVVTGCNIQVVLFEETSNVAISGCSNFCPDGDDAVWTVSSVSSKIANSTCFGVGCCETPIPVGLPSYGVHMSQEVQVLISNVPNAVRIAERGWFQKHAPELLDGSAGDDRRTMPVPVVLEWAVVPPPGEPRDAMSSLSCPTDPNRSACRSSNSKCTNVTGMYRKGYVCQCEEGYGGNPYVPGGCQCIDTFLCRCPPGANDCIDKSNLGLTIGIGVGSGAGLLTLALGAIFVTRKITRRRERILRQRFFEQNRGHLLHQLISQNADIAERMVIPLAELEKATNNFDESRELGGGGHGTVYKGILSNLHVVAIKKSKVSIQREIDEFINEVAILSQINHRNVVKLFGCCLETQVPLLVYEFISNGTLYHHLHAEEEEPTSSLPWEDRLRIATETARALAYLHSAVAFPVIHRDIKSHNILLDGSMTTKVSDFGASRCIPAEKTSVTTAIQGTLGYLDPMYYYTGRLTEKSDVFSFGVLLMELLTRKKPHSYRSPADESLVQHFTSLLNQGGLVGILDPLVVEEGGEEEVGEVAALAVACVKLQAEERPVMRQVEMKLERLRSPASQQQVTTPTHKKVGAKRSNRRSIPAANLGTSSGEEATRQYSLEEEYLLSSRYPR